MRTTSSDRACVRVPSSCPGIQWRSGIPPPAGRCSIEIRQADLVADARTIRALFTACLRAVDERLADLGASSADIGGPAGMRGVDAVMASIDAYAPPHGRLLIARSQDEAIGCGTLRRTGDDAAELGWLYVRPDRRRRGVGRAIVRRLLDEARVAGFARVRLDLAKTLLEARSLAVSEGFLDVPAFPDAGVPRHLARSWSFLERPLVDDAPA